MREDTQSRLEHEKEVSAISMVQAIVYLGVQAEHQDTSRRIRRPDDKAGG